MTKIKCTDCGYENEAERVYCHNCGVKLDRSLIPKEDDKPTPKKVRKRVRKLTNPSSGFFVGFWKTLFSTLIWAAVLAAIIQIVRPPADVPPMPESDLVDAPPISLILENAILKGGGKSILLDEANVNAYLLSTVRSKNTGALGEYVKFDRAFVKPKDGKLDITVQHSIINYPVYATTSYDLSIKEDGSGLEAKNVGGRFGSLPIHPLIMPYLEYPVQKLWGAMKREKRLMDKLAKVEVTKSGIILTPAMEPSSE